MTWLEESKRPVVPVGQNHRPHVGRFRGWPRRSGQGTTVALVLCWSHVLTLLTSAGYANRRCQCVLGACSTMLLHARPLARTTEATTRSSSPEFMMQTTTIYLPLQANWCKRNCKRSFVNDWLSGSRIQLRAFSTKIWILQIPAHRCGRKMRESLSKALSQNDRRLPPISPLKLSRLLLTQHVVAHNNLLTASSQLVQKEPQTLFCK